MIVQPADAVWGRRMGTKVKPPVLRQSPDEVIE
jgi:hypothetical protein